MKKRLLSLIVAAAMLFGMLPAASLGVNAEAAAPVHTAVYAESVTVDGALNEPWVLTSKLTGNGASRAFGTLWNRDALYLAVEKAASDTEAVITINEKELTVTAAGVTYGNTPLTAAAVSVGNGCWEVKLPWSDLNVALSDFNAALSAEISVGGASWSGTVVVSSLTRYEANLRTFNAGHIAAGDAENLEYEELDSGFRMTNKYSGTGSNVNTKTRMYSYDYMEDHPLEGETLVLEYDFRADAMPEYVAPGDIKTIDSLNPCYGYTYYTANNMGKGFCAGITNTTDGLYLCFNGVTGEEIHAVKLNKQLGETFRVRTERDALGVVRTYVDDVLVDTIEGTSVPNGWGRMTNVLVVNLWSGSEFHPTEDQANDVDFTVSNLRYGCTYDDLLKDLSFDDIRGGNTAEDLISSDLILPATYTHPMLGCTYDLTWSSSEPALIAASGKVTPGLADTEVTLTVAIDGGLGEKTFDLAVPRRFVTAYFTEEPFKVDGKLDEYSWNGAMTREFAALGGEGAPTGAVSVLMNSGVAYLAVEFANADALTLKLGEKSWDIDLTKTAFTAQGVEGAIAEGVLELKVDMKALDMAVLDYNTTVKTELILSKGGLATALDADAIDTAFVSKAIVVPDEFLTGEPEDDAPQSEVVDLNMKFNVGFNFGYDAGTDVLTFNCTTAVTYKAWVDKNGGNYASEQSAKIDPAKELLYEQTLTVNKMPVMENHAMTGARVGDGYFINIEDSVKGILIPAVIYNDGGSDGLKLKIWKGTVSSDAIVLGKGLGEEFTLGLKYQPNGLITVYVDGTEKGSAQTSAGSMGSIQQGDSFALYYTYSGSAEDKTCALTITDMKLTISEYEPPEDAPVITDITGANYTTAAFGNITGGAKLNVSRPYWILQPAAAVDFSKDMLIEQTMNVAKLAISTGGFSEITNKNKFAADGLLIRVQEGTTGDHARDSITAVLYHDGNTLKLNVLKADGTAQTVDLGVEVNSTFKLGIDYSAADDTVTVLVDGIERGTVANGVYTFEHWGAKTFAYNYSSNTVGYADTADVTITGIQITTPAEAEEDSGDGSQTEGSEIAFNALPATNYGFGYTAATDTLAYTYTASAAISAMRYGVDKNNALTGGIDPAKVVHYEQTMTVKNMPVAETDMANSRGGDGYFLQIEDVTGMLMGIRIHNSNDGLKLRVWTGSAATEAIALGKSLNESFKLGLKWQPGGTVSVYVDENEVTTVNISPVPMAGVQKGDVVAHYIYAENWSEGDAMSLDISGRKLTITEPAADSGGDEPTDVVTPITSANVVGGQFVNTGSGAKLTSGAAYWAKQPGGGLTAIDFTKDMLFEQNLAVKKLAVSTGAVTNLTNNNTIAADGLMLRIGEANGANGGGDHAGDAIVAVLYNDGTSLKLNVINSQGEPVTVDLKKTAGASFKLGIGYDANDDTITVLVDDEAVGTVEKGVFNGSYWSIKTLYYKYNDTQWGAYDTSEVEITNIRLTTSEPEQIVDDRPGVEIPLTGTLANSAYSISDRTLTISGTATHATHQKAGYWIQQNALDVVDFNKDVLVEQTLCISKMVTGQGTGTYVNVPNEVNGFNIMLEKPVQDGFQFVSVNVFNSGSGIKANVLNANGTTTLIDLGVDLGDEFRLGVLRKHDGSVTVLVDGVEKGTVESGTFSRTTGIYKTAPTLLYYYRDANCVEGTETSMTITDPRVTVTWPAETTLQDLPPVGEELSAGKLLGDVDLSQLSENLTFPDSYVSKWLGKLDLVWESSNEDAVSSGGAVTVPNGKLDQYALITASVKNGPKLWTVEATVPSNGVILEQTPAKVQVSYTAADEENGTMDTKWSLNNKILDGMAKNGAALEGTSVAGTFGIRWGLENLYLAVKAGSSVPTVEINGVDVAVNGDADAKGIVYITVAYGDVNLSAPAAYGVEIPAVITLGDAKWEGVFQLTSNENFIVDGSYERVWSQMAPGTASVGISQKDGNQGVNKTATGWYFYDHYSLNGTNPESIRSYSILWAKGTDNQTHLDTYAPFDDRTHSTYLEFDFFAESMPIYLDGTNSTGWSTSFASYGFTWAMTGSDKGILTADGVSMGIYNTKDGLKFVVQSLDETVDLNRNVGDHFRLGTRWNVDGSLDVYVDGELIAHMENAQAVYQSYGHNALMLNLIRNTEGPTGSQDNFDIYIDNITVAKGNGDTALEFLDYGDLLGENADRLAVTKDLTLNAASVNEQTGWVTDIEWSSDDAAVIDPATGEVTRPTEKGKLVTLTAVGDGDTRTFQFYVQATNYSSNTLMVVGDADTAHGAGVMKDIYEFTLDDTNNSIILDQGESKQINVITLTDGDEVNRLNESFLSIWVSNDNKTYTRVDEYFKVLRDGEKTYLYDFTAEGRYIKVHAMHYDGAEADFTGPVEGMITAEFAENFAAVGEFSVSKELTVSNPNDYTAYDDAWRLALSDAAVAAGTEASIRVYLDGELLYHYVDGSDLIVRIPEIAANGSVTLTVLSGNDNAKDISNREGVHEVVYGTRETVVDSPRRWIASLGDGRLISVASENNPAFEDYDWSTASDVVKGRRAQITWSISEDGGLTWSDETVIENAMSGNLEEDGWINSIGGITYDPDAGELGHGRLLFNGYYYVRFSKNSVENSFCQQRFMYSDDLGKTWVRSPEMTQTGDRSYYNIGYDDAIRLSSFDGEGEGIDYIMTVADQANNNGGFCLRVVYSKDAGLTWTLGAQKLDLEIGSGITAIESGVSEGFLIETTDENGDSMLVLYSRCQYENSTKFAYSTSSDYGMTWTPVVLSSIYASAGQPVMNPFGDDNLMIWGGNHALGTNSYNIMPLTIGVMSGDMRSVSNIQDLYSRYSTQGMTDKTEVRVINQSADSNGDTMSITYWSRPNNLRLRVDNFTDYLYRTKGIYDSFENTTVKYEGWAVTGGVVAVSGEQYTEGSRSMKFNVGSSAVRTVPYLQDGTVTMKLYVADASAADLTVELEAAYSDIYGTAAPVAIKVLNGEVYMLQCSYDADGVKTITNVATGLTLCDGWNTVSFNLQLSGEEPAASVRINQSNWTVMPVDPSVGAYVCYVDINAVSTVVYADEIMVIDTMPVTVPDAPAEPTKEDPKVEQVSILLEGTINANYYMTIPEEIKNDATAHMEITKPNGDVQKVFVKDLDKVTYDGNEYYKVVGSAGVPAKEMTEDIVARFYYRGAVRAEKSFCIKDYGDAVLADSNSTGELKDLVTAMLHYGSYAQTYFDYNTEDLANAGLADYSAAMNGVTAEKVAEIMGTASYGDEQVKLNSVSLLLKEETTLRLFFKIAEGVDPEAVTFNGSKYSGQRNGLYYVDIGNIAAKDLDAIQSVTVVVDGETTEVSYSVMRYCYNVLNSATAKESLKNVAKALYLYNRAANSYFSQN